MDLVIVGILGLLMFLTPFVSYHTIAILLVPWTLISLVAVLFAGIASLRRNFRPARFFMLAWVGCLFFFLTPLLRLGAIPSSIISENGYRLALIWIATCWSIALAARINLQKAQTESANRELRNSGNRLSQILEGMPLGVVLYGNDQKPRYINQRTIELLSDPTLGIRPDLSAGRTLAQAIQYFSFTAAGRHQAYPLEEVPELASFLLDILK